jgi:hypothetical protein
MLSARSASVQKVFNDAPVQRHRRWRRAPYRGDSEGDWCRHPAASGNAPVPFLKGTGSEKTPRGLANIDFPIQGGAELVISTNRADTRRRRLTALNTENLTISRANSWAEFGVLVLIRRTGGGFSRWRPKMIILTVCTNLVVLTSPSATRGMGRSAPNPGCRKVLVDGIKVRNHLDVPYCDAGPGPFLRMWSFKLRHPLQRRRDCRKATRPGKEYGPSRSIVVRDCILGTQDSGRRSAPRRPAAAYSRHPVRALRKSAPAMRHNHPDSG